jgi:formate dehydrogenase subunit delta
MKTRDMVRMANQIGTFFQGYSEEEAQKEIANHLNSFWDPRMRKAFFAHLDAGGEGLNDIVKRASVHIRRPALAG